MKKLISLLIAAVMLVSLCTVTAFAGNGPLKTTDYVPVWARVSLSDIDGDEVFYLVESFFDEIDVDNEAFPGAVYDLSANTLTLTDLDAARMTLFVWYMGDDFTIQVEGDCHLGKIFVRNDMDIYNTNLNITGSGSLTLNENRYGGFAPIDLWSIEGGEQPMKLNIADTVTLHLYASEDENTLINVNGTSLTSAAEAISVGGALPQGVQSKRATATEYTYIPMLAVESTTGTNTVGDTVISNSDPDGKYAVHVWGGLEYTVNRYVYVDAIGMWVVDPSYSELDEQPGRIYDFAEFSKRFTYLQSEQPTRIRFATDEEEANRGWRLLQAAKDSEPGEVYGVSPIWGSEGSSYENPDEYAVYHLIWNEAEGMYYKDASFRYTTVPAGDMEAEGYRLVTGEVEVKAQFRCWNAPAPYEGEHVYFNKYDRIVSAEEPDAVFVRTGTYSWTVNGELVAEGIRVNRVFYDGENDCWYLDENTEAGKAFGVKNEDIGVTYDYTTEMQQVTKEIRYLTENYGFDDYSHEAYLLSKDGEFFAAQPYTVIRSGGEEETRYSVYRLEYREDSGHYYAVKLSEDDEVVAGWDKTPAQLEEEGYVFEQSLQNVPLVLEGYACFYDYLTEYRDADGNLYAASEWEPYAYRCSEDNTVTFGHTVYYIGTLAEDVEISDLTSTEREVETDSYVYWLPGTEYHHEGSGAEPTVLLGDADGDDLLTILDATAIQRSLANLPTASFNEKAADADEDGSVMILDATAIQRKLAALSTHEGIGTKRV